MILLAITFSSHDGLQMNLQTSTQSFADDVFIAELALRKKIRQNLFLAELDLTSTFFLSH